MSQSQAQSHRREYRKFRKPAAPKTSNSVVCKFFETPEGCRFGEKCRFRHDNIAQTIDNKEGEEEKIISEELEQKAVVFEPKIVTNASKPVIPMTLSLKKEDVGSEIQKSQYQAEISFFKKRYRNCLINETDRGTSINFRYTITDPDWVLDLKNLNLNIFLELNHPIDQPTINLPQSSNTSLPTLVQSYLENKIREAIQGKYTLFTKRNSYEIIGKALIKWIDHSIVEIFTEALRRTKLAMMGENIGLSLVMPKKEVKEEEKIEEKKEVIEHKNIPENIEISEQSTSGTEKNIVEKEKFEAVDILPIEIVMIWKDSSNNIATIRAIQLRICTKCTRCSMEKDTDVILNEKITGWRCQKCSQAQSLRIRSELVHQNSNIVGRLESKGCKPIDCILRESEFKIVCLACDKEDDMQKLNYGDTHKSWCRNCHGLMQLTISHIRFRGDTFNGEDKQIAANIPKPKKLVEKRAAIEEGQPLTDNGACEHYKKSYRWFRFPCCGKLYPCDTCHEIKTNGEHEMKQANRMICGYCSKEQLFSKDKPCAGCGEETTRRRTQFWEGGKGCRDQTKMNKNDGHKFANSRKKTIAKTKVSELATKKS